MRPLLLVLLAAAAACPPAKSKLDDQAASPVGSGSGFTSPMGSGSAAPAEPVEDLDSKDILARTDTAPSVYVKHVLIGWKGVGRDPRAQSRSNKDAAALAKDVYNQLKGNPDKIDELVKKYSEDP